MLGIHNFGLFLGAGILLNLTPGPDTAYMLGRSIAQGRAAGIASAFGIATAFCFSRRAPRHGALKMAEPTMSILAAKPNRPTRHE